MNYKLKTFRNSSTSSDFLFDVEVTAFIAKVQLFHSKEVLIVGTDIIVMVWFDD